MMLVTWAQVTEAKEAGAAGVLGTIAQVSVRGAPVLSSFAAALGLDAPVEVGSLYILPIKDKLNFCWYQKELI